MMKKLLLLLCMSIITVLSGKEVIFIPGWNTEYAPCWSEKKLLEKIFPGYQIKIWRWQSNSSWGTARNRAGQLSVDVADHIAKMPPKQQREVILIGHSLGGRCAAHTAHRLKAKNIKIKQVILLGSAISRYDHRLASCGDVSLQPVFNIFCPDDRALSLYNCAEIFSAPVKAKMSDHSAAGQYGIALKHRNIWQFRLRGARSLQESRNIITAYYNSLKNDSRNVTSWWALGNDFIKSSNHICLLYLTELSRIYPDPEPYITTVPAVAPRKLPAIPRIRMPRIPKVNVPKVNIPQVNIPEITPPPLPEFKKHLPAF